MDRRSIECAVARTLRSGRSALVVVLAAGLATGCSDLTAGGTTESSEVVVSVSGDAEDQNSEEAAHAEAAPPVPAGLEASVPLGEVTLTMDLELEGPDGTWTSLTDGLQQLTVDLAGAEEPIVSRTTLDPGVYPRTRLTVTSIRADVTGGLPVLGPGPVDVDFGGDDAVVVERSLELDLEDDDVVEILIDLNSAQWLRAATPAIRIVAAVHLRNALEIRVQ